MSSEFSRNLSRARRGSVPDFFILVKGYQTLAFAYLRSCTSGSVTEAMTGTQRLFYSLWLRREKFARMADFEKAFISSMREVPCKGEGAPGFTSPFRSLSVEDRLLALAVEIENWSLDRAAKAFGLNRNVIETELLRIRCDLIGVHFINLTDEESLVLRDLSTHLCRDLPERKKRRMADATTRCSEIRDFKSRCLEKRCEMVEFWLDIRLSEQEEAWLVEGIADLIEGKGSKTLAPIPQSRWILPFRRREDARLS